MNQTTFDIFKDKTTAIQSPRKTLQKVTVENLSQAEIGKEYIIEDVMTTDKEIANFLFTLGCFKGEPITVISVLSENYVIAIKDARYSVDAELANAISCFKNS